MKVEEQDGIVTLELEGRVAQGACDELEEALAGVYDKDSASQVIIDFTNTTHISSAALGILVFSKKRFAKTAGDIRLVITNQELLNLFETTLLNKVFEIYSLPEEATNAILDEI